MVGIHGITMTAQAASDVLKHKSFGHLTTNGNNELLKSLMLT
jgi:hypothetical protein